MKRWAVAHADLSDNLLTIEFIEAETVNEAVKQFSKIKKEDWLDLIPDKVEEIEDFFWNADVLLTAKEVI